jgi:hypothetical protein
VYRRCITPLRASPPPWAVAEQTRSQPGGVNNPPLVLLLLLPWMSRGTARDPGAGRSRRRCSPASAGRR